MSYALELSNYKKKAVNIARDFNYSDKVIADIKAAKTEKEVSAIMRRARINREEKELNESWIERVKITPSSRK